MLLIFQIIAFDVVPADSKFNKENTCDRQSIKTLKSSNINKREVSQVSFDQTNKEISLKYSHGHFTNVLDRLTC